MFNDEKLGETLKKIELICMSAIFGLLLAFPIEWAWNYIIPYLFGLKDITWGQAWCINFLATCLIKSVNR